MGRNSSVGIAITLKAGRYRVRNPVGRFSAHTQAHTGPHPPSYTMGAGSFPEAKQLGRGLNHPPPYSADIKERVELYFYSPSVPSWHITGRILPLKQRSTLFFLLFLSLFHFLFISFLFLLNCCAVEYRAFGSKESEYGSRVLQRTIRITKTISKQIFHLTTLPIVYIMCLQVVKCGLRAYL
jgi:hypothetical protein